MAIEDTLIASFSGSEDSFIAGISGGVFGALLAVGIMFFVLFIIAVYIYVAFSWMTIAKKMKCKKHWLAWIPIANFFLLPILLKKKWTWGFMFFAPGANIVFFIIWSWKIFELRKYPGWLSLSIIIPKVGNLLYFIAIGFVAFKDRKKK